eukprot:TRINITY_DN30693_c0_g1_i1.p1 TRINITY_DN30693_c0_g1~~TRINITY_DN30693_c0_g1_i1.p1  ORF type:complete len:799 (+),score=270.44 TRINITY_DN30693_c0_g1_i1:69-2465(+)
MTSQATREQLLQLPIRDLRKRAADASCDVSGCLEKGEFVDALLRSNRGAAQPGQPAGPLATSSGGVGKLAEVRVERPTPDTRLGASFGPRLDVQRVDEQGPARLSGLARCLGWRVVAVDGADVFDPASLSDAVLGKTKFTMRLRAPPPSKDVMIARSDPTERLGVTFSSSLVVENVQPAGPGDRAGLGSCVSWRVCKIDGAEVAETQDLIEAVQGKVSCVFTLHPPFDEGKAAAKPPAPAPAAGGPPPPPHLRHRVQTAAPAAPQPAPRQPPPPQRPPAQQPPIAAPAVPAPQPTATATAKRREVVLRRQHSDERLGVTFSADGVVVEGVSDTGSSFRSEMAQLKGWRVTHVDGNPVGSVPELAEAIKGKATCVFALQPPGGAASRAPPTSGSGDDRNWRDLTLFKKHGDERLGLHFYSGSLTIDGAANHTAARRHGLHNFSGWKVHTFDGFGVNDRDELDDLWTQKGVGTVALRLVLENDRLPSSIVQVELAEMRTEQEVLNAFVRCGQVVHVHPTERVTEMPCKSCRASMGVADSFCGSCGAKSAGYFGALCRTHVTFRKVDDARRAVRDAVSIRKNLRGLWQVRFFHPPKQEQQAYAEADPVEEEGAKPSHLAMAQALGFFNAYGLLGVPLDASDDEVQRAFKKKSLEYHPDKNKDGGEMFKACAKAKKILCDPTERAALRKEVDKAVKSFGKKAVMARIPSRGKTQDAAKGKADEVAAAAPAAAQEQTLFAGYHTGSVGGGRWSAYGVLQSVEVMPKAESYEEDEPAPPPEDRRRRRRSRSLSSPRRRRRRRER